MKVMTKLVYTSLILLVAISAKAQTNKWKELTLTNQAQYQAKGIAAQIFKETYAGLEGQQYTVKFTNSSTQKLKIMGSLTAHTYCGNSLSTNIDVTIKPGQSLGGNDYLMDNVGLTGTVHTEDCKTDKIYPNPNDKNTYKYDRIRGLTLGALMIVPIADPNAAVPNQATTAVAKPVANAPTISTPVVKPAAVSGQNSQQAAYQQQANNYINAANASTEDISKATNLNLAKINAAASGNKAQVAQIQQAQDQQMQDQIQSISTSLVGMLMNSKTKREREREKDEAVLEKLTLRNEKIKETIQNLHSVYLGFKTFRQKKQDSVDKIWNYIRLDFQKIKTVNSYAGVLQQLFNANMRMSRIDQIKQTYWLSLLYDRKNNMAPIYTEHGVATIDYAADPSFDIANPPLKDKDGKWVYDIAFNNNFKTDDLYSAINHYELSPASLKVLDKAGAANVGAFNMAYFNALANVYDYKDKKSDRNFVKNYTAASGYFNQLPAVDKTDTTTYFQYKNVKFGDHYLSLGNMGLKQMLVYELRGEMSYDSASTTQNKNLYISAFQNFTKATDYYSANLKAYANRTYLLSQKTDDSSQENQNAPYYFSLFNTLNNLLITANKVIASPDFTQAQKQLVVERCVKSFADCYFSN